MTSEKKISASILIFLNTMSMISCIKKPNYFGLNADNLDSTKNANTQVKRAKVLFEKSDYETYLKELIYPAADRAINVLENFKSRHAKIPKTSWKKSKVSSLISDLHQFDLNIQKKSQDFRFNLNQLSTLIQAGIDHGDTWDTAFTVKKRKSIVESAEELIDSARKMKSSLSSSSYVDSNDLMNLNAVLPRIKSLAQWAQLLNFSSEEMEGRLKRSQENLKRLKENASVNSSTIHAVFKETLCDFVFSSARIATSGLDRNAQFKGFEGSLELCDLKTEDLSGLIMAKKAWILPFWGKLTKLDFVEMVSTPVILLGLNAAHITYSDGIPGTQYSFFEHDVGHAHEILTHLFGDFEPSAESLTSNTSSHTFLNQLLELTKRFTNEEKARAREIALRQFLTVALKPDLNTKDRELIVNVVFELVHEFPYMSCAQSDVVAESFPRCSYGKTLVKSKTQPILAATYLKRYLADGLELIVKPENEYWLMRILQTSTAGSDLEATGVTNQQITAARSTLDGLNKRANDVLEW
jgi:hypothetical protein